MREPPIVPLILLTITADLVGVEMAPALCSEGGHPVRPLKQKGILMTKFDGTIDNRYRPDLESSQRRVREEEAEEAVPVVQSRELSFVPTRYKKDESAYDPQTRALIEEHKRLELLRHGSKITNLMERWNWLEAMATPDQKQLFLEEHIHAVHQDPVKNEFRLIFLLLVLEPIRRGISKKYIDARGGYNTVKDFSGSGADLRLIQHLDRQDLFDVTRRAALEAIFRYPTPHPDRIFSWFKATVAYRALDELKEELPDLETAGLGDAESVAVSRAVSGLMDLDPPDMRSDLNMGAWMRRVKFRDVFDTVENFYDFSAVRKICDQAIGRLSPGQSVVIRQLYLEEKPAEAIAEEGGVTRSTIDNHASKGRKKMADDDVFFCGLHELGHVKDEARAKDLAEKYPDGKLPDGRRVVHIGMAA